MVAAETGGDAADQEAAEGAEHCWRDRHGRAAFPDGFVWGVATAAYQIEGATEVDGRSWGIWDAFSKIQRRVSGGASGDVACDHYNLFEKDVELLKSLGIRHYQFSVAWPRVQPNGRGPACQAGLRFYERLVDCLIGHGIEPIVTLYHWDLPVALQIELGGWESPEIVPIFADYARMVFEALGHRGVRRWVTLHEPYCTAVQGYGDGSYAPGIQAEERSVYMVGHNLLLAHAAAVQVFREEFRLHESGAEIGLVLSADWAEPADLAAPSGGVASAPTSPDHPQPRRLDLVNAEAARRILDCSIGWFASPLFDGAYPAEMRARSDDILPEFTAEQQQMLRGSADFLGLWQHSCQCVEVEQEDGEGAVATAGSGSLAGIGEVHIGLDPQWKLDDSGLPMTPWALRKVLLWVQERYQPRGGLYVLGPCFSSRELSRQRAQDDADRVHFLHGHIEAVHSAMKLGANVKGYFAWTLLDGFDWQDGYSMRSGLVHVDFATQARTLKGSALWLSHVIEQNALPALAASDGAEPLLPWDSRTGGPFWWIVEEGAGEAKEAAEVAVPESSMESMEAGVQALLQIFRSQTNPIENDEQVQAISEMDPSSVICTLEALDLHLHSYGTNAGMGAVGGVALEGGGGLKDLAACVASEVEQARTEKVQDAGPQVEPAESQPDEHLMLEQDARRAERATAVSAACAQWDEAIDKAVRWKAEQLDLLWEAGPALQPQHAELAAVNPVMLAASLLYLKRPEQGVRPSSLGFSGGEAGAMEAFPSDFSSTQALMDLFQGVLDQEVVPSEGAAFDARQMQKHLLERAQQMISQAAEKPDSEAADGNSESSRSSLEKWFRNTLDVEKWKCSQVESLGDTPLAAEAARLDSHALACMAALFHYRPQPLSDHVAALAAAWGAQQPLEKANPVEVAERGTKQCDEAAWQVMLDARKAFQTAAEVTAKT